VENKNRTEQEIFWAGEFGTEYSNRNVGANILASNIALFAAIFKCTPKLNSVIEFGPNIGLNLRALDLLYPGQEQVAVEINHFAAKEINDALPNTRVLNLAISDFESGMLSNGPCDLVLIKGVLIHIHPDQLKMVYKKIYESTKKFILICEYYNPKPDIVSYRGHPDKLFRRDFAGELLDLYRELKLVNYGFVYHRDPSFPQDDFTWFLLEKS
jgi:pseudaminic acid biosynthesis-associated methylase